MVDFTIGLTLHFGKKKPAPITGKVFYKNGQHIIEIHDRNNAYDFIKGLIPPLAEDMMTRVEPKHANSKEHGIG